MRFWIRYPQWTRIIVTQSMRCLGRLLVLTQHVVLASTVPNKEHLQHLRPLRVREQRTPDTMHCLNRISITIRRSDLSTRSVSRYAPRITAHLAIYSVESHLTQPGQQAQWCTCAANVSPPTSHPPGNAKDVHTTTAATASTQLNGTTTMLEQRSNTTLSRRDSHVTSSVV